MTMHKRFKIDATWDAEAGLWRASNDELPYSDSAMSYEGLAKRLIANGPQIAKVNGFGANVDFYMVRHPVRVLYWPR